MQLFFSAVTVVLLSTAVWHHGDCSTVQQRTEVLEHVMRSRGNVHVRPDGEEGDGSPVLVNVSFSLLRISSLNVFNSRLEMVGYLFLRWIDPRLSFASDYVTALRVPVTDIWTPDIELYYTDSKIQVLNQQPLAVVLPSGEVILVYNVALHAMCWTDVTRADMRTQCRLTFGSWTYSGKEIDLAVPEHMDLSEYVLNQRWSISSQPEGERYVRNYTCCPEPYVSAVFKINLHKRPE